MKREDKALYVLLAACGTWIIFWFMFSMCTRKRDLNVDSINIPVDSITSVPSIDTVRKKLTGLEIKDYNKKTEYIHAGADEMYPNMGYDENGWSLRGYMSSYELKGKHCTTPESIVKFKNEFERRKQVFVDTITERILEVCKGTSVPPSIVIAQAIIESAHGMSRLKIQANNMFGHMYHEGSCIGPFHENGCKGIDDKIKAFDRNVNGKLKSYYFRKYQSVWWCIKYHIWLLENGYKGRRIKAKTDRESWLAALCGCKDSRMLASDSKKSSYLYAGACAWEANDGKTSSYVENLRFIIKLYNLQKVDEIWRNT
jgi:hypothetical protein